MEQNFYLDKLLKLKDNFSVKIISGVRGVGKTTLLKLFAEKLRSDGVDEAEIIFVDCAANRQLKNFQTFYEFIESRSAELEKFFLLVDEIDCVVDGEKAINALFVGTSAEIYVTTSGENFAEKISALLPENCDVLKMYSLSFAECVKNLSLENDLKNYMHFGGLPETIGVDEKVLPRLLRGMTYEIIFDLVEKNALRNAEFFRRMLQLFAQNVGKTINLNSLLNDLGGVMRSGTVKKYFDLCTAVFKKISRYDIKAEKFLQSGEKFYCIDNGILCALAQELDETALMENVVCIELLRRGYSVNSGKFGVMNITFVAERGDEKIFIQVLPTSGVSVRRVTRPLRALPTDAKKFVITLKHEKNFGDVQNITLRDFLLNG